MDSRVDVILKLKVKGFTNDEMAFIELEVFWKVSICLMRVSYKIYFLYLRKFLQYIDH